MVLQMSLQSIGCLAESSPTNMRQSAHAITNLRAGANMMFLSATTTTHPLEPAGERLLVLLHELHLPTFLTM
jgi:hypothetical protein